MTLLNTLLALNWLEQGRQADKTRRLIGQIKPASSMPLARSVIDQHLQRVQDDPQTLQHWMKKKGGLATFRMALFGMTKAEEKEAMAAAAYESKMGFPE